MDYFDLASGAPSLASAFDRTRSRFLVLSFTSDWLYPTYQSLETVSALRSRNIDVAFCELNSNYGHDAFLLETREQSEMITGFLSNVSRDLAKPASRPAALGTAQVNTAISTRPDYAMIAALVEPGSRILDLGCGEGELLAALQQGKHVEARGVEIDPNKVRRAIARGVSAYQSDIDHGLTDYPDKAFDFVILSQTLQETRYPLTVLREMLRVGKHGIVAFPNFGHWTTRISHLTSGRAPRTQLFPHEWHESPNLHFLTIDDFILLCRSQAWTIERQIFLSGTRQVRRLANLMAETAVFSLRAGA
jgi:methionine biosynthesis protein MetW